MIATEAMELLTEPGKKTNCKASVPTTSAARMLRRCSIHKLVASFVMSQAKFRRKASSKRPWKKSWRPKAWIVFTPESVSSNMWNIGPFVTKFQRIASRLARRWISRTAKKASPKTSMKGATKGRTMQTRTSWSKHVQTEMKRTSNCKGVVQSMIIWSSPHLLMMRPDGVLSKKLVLQCNTFRSMPPCTDCPARTPANAQTKREPKLSAQPNAPMVSQRAKYHSWGLSSRSSCHTARKISGATSLKLKSQEQQARNTKTCMPPTALM
mmetsp:Transcript_103089/g.295848  ORF Transcript_103089/g.295848 Transcript_103089/m.295848 type:complete len:267 (+) Transcript_103089:262-1062(+)